MEKQGNEFKEGLYRRKLLKKVLWRAILARNTHYNILRVYLLANRLSYN